MRVTVRREDRERGLRLGLGYKTDLKNAIGHIKRNDRVRVGVRVRVRVRHRAVGDDLGVN